MSDEVNTKGFVNRELHDHKVNKFNREHVIAFTADERASDNAHHAYRIEVYKGNVDGVPSEMVSHCDITFQNGGLREVGPNGVTDQSLLAVILDRIRSFNDGQFRCRENSIIITKLEEALLWMEKRGNDRARRGVEGERAQ